MSNLLSIWDWTLNRCATQIGGDVGGDEENDYGAVISLLAWLVNNRDQALNGGLREGM